LLLAAGVCGCVDRPYRVQKIDPAGGNQDRNWEVVPPVEVSALESYCKAREESGDEYEPSATIEKKQDEDGGLKYWLGFVEVDDQGQLWAKVQRDFVFDELDAYADGDEGSIVIVYVHGFRHNAAVCDEKLEAFRWLLRHLAEMERRRVECTDERPRKVAGVFVGWRGSQSRGKNPFGFGERKRGAHRVGEGAGIELMSRVASLNRSQKQKSERSRLLVIGHSLGSAVLMSAMHARYEWILANWNNEQIDRDTRFASLFGDLVVFVNPAFEALRFHEIHRLSRGIGDYDGPTLIVSVSTEEDAVTGVDFRAAMRGWYKTGDFRNRAQKKAFITAFGQYEPYWTHEISEETMVDCVDLLGRRADPCEKEQPRDEARQDPLEQFAVQYAMVPEGASEEEAEEYEEEQKEEAREGDLQCVDLSKVVDLRGTGKSANPKPSRGKYAGPYFSFVDMDGSLMEGHNDEVENEALIVFIEDLLDSLGILDPRADSPTGVVDDRLMQQSVQALPPPPPVEPPPPLPVEPASPATADAGPPEAD
jgi:hypothetical protein